MCKQLRNNWETMLTEGDSKCKVVDEEDWIEQNEWSCPSIG